MLAASGSASASGEADGVARGRVARRARRRRVRRGRFFILVVWAGVWGWVWVVREREGAVSRGEIR